MLKVFLLYISECRFLDIKYRLGCRMLVSGWSGGWKNNIWKMTTGNGRVDQTTHLGFNVVISNVGTLALHNFDQKTGPMAHSFALFIIPSHKA